MGLKPGKQNCYVSNEEETTGRGQQLVEPLTPGGDARDRNRAKGKLKRAVSMTGQMPMKRQIL